MTASRKALIVVAAFFLLALGLPWGGNVPAAFAQTVSVTAADPPTGEQGTLNLSVIIKGKGFKNGANAKFFKAGTTDPAGVSVQSTQFVSSTQLIANIDIADTAALSKFDIQVANADGRTGKGTELFSVTSKIASPAITAVFRDAVDDKVTSDGMGIYAPSGGNSMIVELSSGQAGGPVGDLRFILEATSGRTIGIDFSDVLRPSPDGFLPPGMDDPVASLHFRTMQSGGAEPRLNFLTMTHNQTALVRLFFDFWTASGDHYALRGDPNYPNTGTSVAGPVQVTSIDTHCETVQGCDGVVERWFVEPVAGTESAFQMVRFVRNKGNYIRQDLGDLRLPFLIVFGPA